MTQIADTSHFLILKSFITDYCVSLLLMPLGARDQINVIQKKKKVYIFTGLEKWLSDKEHSLLFRRS